MINEKLGAKTINRLLQVEYNEQVKKSLDSSTIESIYEEYNVKGVINNKEFMVLNNEMNLDLIIGAEKTAYNEALITSDLMEENYKVGDSFEIVINNKHYKFKCVGIVKNDYQKIYISDTKLKDIATEHNYTPLYYRILVKKYSQVDTVIKKLEDKGYYATLENVTDQEEIAILKKINGYVDIITLIVFIILIIIIFNILRIIYSNEEKNIAILKISGYKNTIILFIILVRVFIIVGISYVLFSMFLLILYVIVKIFDIQVLLYLFLEKHFIKYILLFPISTIIVNIIYFPKIRNLKILDVLNE